MIEATWTLEQPTAEQMRPGMKAWNAVGQHRWYWYGTRDDGVSWGCLSCDVDQPLPDDSVCTGKVEA